MATVHAKLLGVKIGAGTFFYGFPILEAPHLQSIDIGAQCSLISDSRLTALGVNHPVVLRALTPTAKIMIGDRVGISGASICAATEIRLGDDCLVGANVTITDTDFHNADPTLRHDMRACHLDAEPIAIGKNVFIGANTLILKGVTIGRDSVIGAGSVVTKAIPSGVVAAGNPCKVLREC